MENHSLIGRQKEQAELFTLCKNDRLPHALFFSGTSGIGKKLLAYKLALHMFCRQAEADYTDEISNADEGHRYSEKLRHCAKCHQCRLLLSCNHPDFYEIDCEDRKTWNTDAIRKLLYSLHLKPFENEKRFIIFNNAEHMRAEAANALLKVLEEPPKDTHFCLIANNAKTLPQTIISRSQVWYIQKLTKNELQACLKERNIDNADISEELLELADGSMEMLLQYIQEADDIELISNVIEKITAGHFDATQELVSFLKANPEKEKVLHTFLCNFSKTRMRQAGTNTEARFWSHLTSQLIVVPELRERNVNQGYLYQLLLAELAKPPVRNTLNLEHITA